MSCSQITKFQIEASLIYVTAAFSYILPYLFDSLRETDLIRRLDISDNVSYHLEATKLLHHQISPQAITIYGQNKYRLSIIWFWAGKRSRICERKNIMKL